MARAPVAPTSIERQYVKTLSAIWLEAHKLVMRAFDPLLNMWPKVDAGNDPTPDPIYINEAAVTRQIRWLELVFGDLLSEERIVERINPVAERVSRFAHRELQSIIGIDVSQNVPGVSDHIAEWRRQNVKLIKGGLEDMRGQIDDVFKESLRSGLRVEKVADLLRERFRVSLSRANLIARDQVLKLNGQITRQRQQSVGISQYRWVTSRDERVRPAHRILDGTIQQWDNPPSEGNPGDAVLCRCIAVPIAPSWLELPTRSQAT